MERLEGARGARLINLTGRPVTLMVGDRAVTLPSGPMPVVLERHRRESSMTLAVDVDGQLADVTVEAVAAEPAAVLGLPAPGDDVVYLVSSELLARLPHRKDLLSPALFRAVGHAAGVDRDARSVLTAVQAAAAPASEQVPSLPWDDLAPLDSESTEQP